VKSAPFHVWMMACWLVAVSTAAGQGITTPVRASWTEDSSSAVTITWDTPVASRGTVRYGLTSNYTHVVHDGGGLYRHAIPVRNLQAGTRYFYEASSTDGYASSNATFQTAPVDGSSLHFVFHGDLNGGVDVPWAESVAEEIVQEGPQWVVQLGDLSDEAYGGAGFDTWTNFFSICEEEMSKAVFMPIPGNHDDPGIGPISAHERGYYHRLFSLPEPSLGKGHYAYTAGNIRIICLNSEAELEAQNDWLARELQAAANDTNLTWIIATCHRPPYSWGQRSGSDDVKEAWSPLFVRYEADWVVSGHSHNYQRTIPIRGVRYLITGGGGASPYASATDEGSLAYATSCYHHVSAHVTNDVMQVRGIRSDGRIFDTDVVTHRRHVRVEPAFPLRGETATITYCATAGPLAAEDSVYLYLGQDEFTNAFLNVPLTWNASVGEWETVFTVPADVTNRLAFVFHNAAEDNWHNNYDYNWQALLARASVSPALPSAGTTVTLRYEADMGPLAGAAQVTAWFAVNGRPFTPTGGVDLVQGAGERWEGTVSLPDFAERLTVAFSSNAGWDDNSGRQWVFPVAGAVGEHFEPAPMVGRGSPVVTEVPGGDGERNNIGDNFDLAQVGIPLRRPPGPYGFGDWGSIWFNQDETNLYVGAMGVDMAGSNNVMVLFLGVDTLSDNAWNLWHKEGVPNALDFLHNVRFTEPMDIALVLGDQYGDGNAFTNFSYGDYDFGQGLYYIGTNSTDFVPVTGARLSQFDGVGTTACTSAWDSAHRQTTRWEAAIPWSSLGAASPTSALSLFVCGVMASASVNTNDRYLSRSSLGERVWGDMDVYGQHAYNTAIFRPARINLPHADLMGDGLSNEWRQKYFGTPGGPPADEDTDGDGQTNREEEIGGSDPMDEYSRFEIGCELIEGEHDGLIHAFRVQPLDSSGSGTAEIELQSATDARGPYSVLEADYTNTYFVPTTPGFYRIKARKQAP
jgi:Calcineurin-like phosphoesterase/Purple acid Phosphatase, N-terminal domain